MTTAGTEYLAFVTAQLTEDRATKASLEARGITVITTSGGLVTLLFGLTALATKAAATYTLPVVATDALIVAAVLFVLAACFGLITNWAVDYLEASAEGLDELLNRDWADEQEQGQLDVASTTIEIIKTYRRRNAMKATWLRVAMGLEILAVVGIVAAVVDILSER